MNLSHQVSCGKSASRFRIRVDDTHSSDWRVAINCRAVLLSEVRCATRMFYRFRILPILAGLMLYCLSMASVQAGDATKPGGFLVYGHDGPGALLTLPKDASNDIREAVLEFQKRVVAMGGPMVEIREVMSKEEWGRTIRFVEKAYPESPLFPPNADDRFSIKVSVDEIIIGASDPIGWEFGLYTLLDIYGGVRWYWPGEEGVYTPQRDEWLISVGEKEFEPAYVSRRFAGLRSADESQWARRNRLKSSFTFSHNLRSIFKRDFFLENPETLVVEWDPENPPGPNHPLWRSQPDLTSEVVVAAAAEAAIEDFRQNPDRASFALGTNDNTRFGESPGIKSLTRPMRYFRDLPDYSNLVFHFMNRVAEEVAQEFPDRFLGCLSYMWVENVPDFPVHPMVLPYLTADRSQGHDVEFTERDRELIEKWTKAGPRLIGIYDYLHAAPHSFPRRANLLIGQRIRDAHQAGVRAYFAEVNPIWPFHGDLPWAVARMLWDPDLKPGELEAEFFNNFFGPAAPYLQKFYSDARWIWMTQEGSAVWVKYFLDEAGIELFSEEDLDRLSGYLEEAKEAAGDSLFGTRVEAVGDAWELTLASAGLQRSRRYLAQNAPEIDSPVPIIEFLLARNGWNNTFESLTAKPWMSRVGRTNFAQSDPLYHAVSIAAENITTDRRAAFWDGINSEALRLKDQPAQIIINLARKAEKTPTEIIATAENIREDLGEIHQFGPEPWEVDLKRPWHIRVNPSERVSIRYVAVDGKEIMRIEDAHAAGISREFSVGQGSFYEAEVELSAKISPGNRSNLSFRWWGEKDLPLGTTRAIRIPSSESPLTGSYRVFGLPPANAVRGAFVIAAVRQEEGDWLDIQSIRMIRFE